MLTNRRVVSFRSETMALGRVSLELSVPPSPSTRQRNPARVCTNRWRWSESVMRPHQALEMHLKWWRELASTGGRTSRRARHRGCRGRAPPPSHAVWGLDPRYRPHPLRSSRLPPRRTHPTIRSHAPPQQQPRRPHRAPLLMHARHRLRPQVCHTLATSPGSCSCCLPSVPSPDRVAPLP
jgi:hypothetical protein